MAKWNIDKLCRPKKYMGQIMAEWDCQHHACDARGYYMAEIPSPEAIVRAALERAADEADEAATRCLAVGAEQKAIALSLFAKAIRHLASNPAEVTAIIKKAGERHD